MSKTPMEVYEESFRSEGDFDDENPFQVEDAEERAINAVAAHARREALDKLWRDLNTMKWVGADHGWDLAIEAVRADIYQLLNASPGSGGQNDLICPMTAAVCYDSRDECTSEHCRRQLHNGNASAPRPTPSTAGGQGVEEEMCPNCVTPWRCNGPHVPDNADPSSAEPSQRTERPTPETDAPGRIPDLEGARCNAEYWLNAAREVEDRNEAVIAIEQVANAWKNAAYAMADQRDDARRELADMERRALEAVAMNERQAVNFAKCQVELDAARSAIVSTGPCYDCTSLQECRARRKCLDAVERGAKPT